MAVKLSFDERKWLLKCSWKVENVVEVQCRWRVQFGISPPTRVTITRIPESLKSMERCKMCWKVGAEERKVTLITRVLMQSCRFLHDAQTSQWENVLVRLVSRNPVFIAFWTYHQWYSISNNPDSLSLCSTSLLRVYCGRSWTFWTCTGLRKFKE